MMSVYMVPCTVDYSMGDKQNIRRRNVRVEAEDEWMAQRAAGDKIDAEPVTLKRPRPLSVVLEHAIMESAGSCSEGCCRRW
jgi:hypothetical protein